MVDKLGDCSEPGSTARTARNNHTLTALGDRWRLINECVEIMAENLMLQSSEQFGFLHDRTPDWCLEERGRHFICARPGISIVAAHQSSEAVAEFQKILDRRGVVVNEPIGALAHLQMGRAYAMQGHTTKAKAAYQDFLALWKDADPYIPILIAAKSEYAKLK
jgi:hypothetical protein